MKNLLLRVAISLFSLCVVTVVASGSAHAYSNTRLMDDAIFDNVHSMTEQQIRDFINSRPTSCLATSGAIFPEPITYFSYGPNNVDAARVIYNAAVYSDINPQVILATLQKEQSLITRTDCFEHPSNIDVRNKAMGQGCPDGGPCPSPAYAGFHQQVMKGAWQLAFNRQRATGNLEWGDNGSIVYSGGYYTEGNRRDCDTSSCPSIYRDGFHVIDGQNIKLETGATASFYRYTPHLGQALPGIFESWFGSTLVPTYDWQLIGQYAYTDQTKTTAKSMVGMLPGDRAYVGFKAKNMGNTTWYKDSGPGQTAIKAGTISPLDRNSPFCDTSTWGYGCNRPATLSETSVAPGETGTFEFWMIAPQTPGTYHERLSLIIDGQAWFPDRGLDFYSTVLTPVYSWQFVGQYAYADQTKTAGKGTTGLLPGDRVYVGFRAKNTGNMTWYRDGAYPVSVGMTHPLDRASPFYDGSWLGTNRPTRLVEASVAPGETGTFEFWIKAPNQPGTYNEYYSLLAEGKAWMNDPGLNFHSTVATPIYSWQLVGQYAYTDQTKTTGKSTLGLHSGDRVYVGFRAKNTGNVTWTNSGPNPINVGMTHPLDRLSAFFDSTWLGQNRPTHLIESSVPPGGTGTFEYWMKAPSQTGTYPEYFSLVIEGRAWLNDPSMNFYSTVTP